MPAREDWRYDEPDLVRFTNDYVKRLLIEWFNIKEKLYNPGGSIILTATARVDPERVTDYSTEIGNTFHVDLMELEDQLSGMPKDDVEALMTWAVGMTSDQAAVFLNARGNVNIKQRRAAAVEKQKERALKTLKEKLESNAYGPGE